MSLTTDISKMDLSGVTEMLTAFQQENTTPLFKAMWYNEDTVPTLNEESGYCFLTNSDYQVSMMNEGKLSMFLNCSECGKEDFEQDWEVDFKGSQTCHGCEETKTMVVDNQ